MGMLVKFRSVFINYKRITLQCNEIYTDLTKKESNFQKRNFILLFNFFYL